MTVYQLIFKGSYKCFGGNVKFNSKLVYKNKEDITEKVIEDFIDICCDGSGLFDVDRSTVELKIVELILI